MIDDELARRLVQSQFPQWSALPLRLVDPAGSDHVIYRLGDELAVRLPRHDDAAGQIGKELRWLPRLAPHLPLRTPSPVAVGRPASGYPWPWAVSHWLDGQVATVAMLGESVETAVELASFLSALQGVPAVGGHAELAGRPLADRDAGTRRAIAAVADVFDAEAMTAVWDAACDLTIAFSLLSATGRAAFREALTVDDATWARGRGWALAAGVNAYTSYAAVNPRVAVETTRQITAAISG